MNIQSLLEIADQIVYDSTGKHLTDLQSDLLKAAYHHQTYEQFASDRGYCLDYIKKDVGAGLWHLLSEALGEKVTKKNFRQALERFQSSQNRHPSKQVIANEETTELSLKGVANSLEGTNHKYAFIALVGLGEINQNSLLTEILGKIPVDLKLGKTSYLSNDNLSAFPANFAESNKFLDQLILKIPNSQEVQTKVCYLYESINQIMAVFPCLIIFNHADVKLKN